MTHNDFARNHYSKIPRLKIDAQMVLLTAETESNPTKSSTGKVPKWPKRHSSQLRYDCSLKLSTISNASSLSINQRKVTEKLRHQSNNAPMPILEIREMLSACALTQSRQYRINVARIIWSRVEMKSLSPHNLIASRRAITSIALAVCEVAIY